VKPSIVWAVAKRWKKATGGRASMSGEGSGEGGEGNRMTSWANEGALGTKLLLLKPTMRARAAVLLGQCNPVCILHLSLSLSRCLSLSLGSLGGEGGDLLIIVGEDVWWCEDDYWESSVWPDWWWRWRLFFVLFNFNIGGVEEATVLFICCYSCYCSVCLLPSGWWYW